MTSGIPGAESIITNVVRADGIHALGEQFAKTWISMIRPRKCRNEEKHPQAHFNAAQASLTVFATLRDLPL